MNRLCIALLASLFLSLTVSIGFAGPDARYKPQVEIPEETDPITNEETSPEVSYPPPPQPAVGTESTIPN
ncbi:MAG: hypothetical protein ACRCYY_13050 [Trueperaceae bacterium]